MARNPETRSSTPWNRGRIDGGRTPRLLFGRMFEDPSIEIELFPPGRRIFAIASAGCTAFALAHHGCHVTAVDINPAQISYVQRRISGEPVSVGTVDRIMAMGRRMLSSMGLSRANLTTFLMMDDPKEQHRFWRERLNTRRFRFALDRLIAPRWLALLYRGQFLSGLPARFPAIIQERLEHGFSIHPNRTNPYAWRLFLGCDPPGFSALAPRPLNRLFCADAAAFLESEPSGSFDGFTLSNIFDGVDAGYSERLLAAVRHAATPAAMLVIRGFREPRNNDERVRASMDRSLIWGSVRVDRMD